MLAQILSFLKKIRLVHFIAHFMAAGNMTGKCRGVSEKVQLSFILFFSMISRLSVLTEVLVTLLT